MSSSLAVALSSINKQSVIAPKTHTHIHLIPHHTSQSTHTIASQQQYIAIRTHSTQSRSHQRTLSLFERTHPDYYTSASILPLEPLASNTSPRALHHGWQFKPQYQEQAKQRRKKRLGREYKESSDKVHGRTAAKSSSHKCEISGAGRSG